jgi:FKBP-type peptidyl-prolyl cis-trans isomerase
VQKESLQSGFQSQLKDVLNDIIEEQRLYAALDEVHERESERLGSIFKLFEIYEALEDLDEKRKRKKRRKKKKKSKKKSSSRKLSKAVKKSLDKKADKRCLTRGSVYAEFRAGLGAYYTSGSRKGMSPHQWAHARVNSATPSKKWAKVKKRKKCPKKKKK